MLMKQSLQGLHEKNVFQSCTSSQISTYDKLDETTTNPSPRNGQYNINTSNIPSQFMMNIKPQFQTKNELIKQNYEGSEAITDRFIPSRKLINKERLLNKQISNQNQNHEIKTCQINNVSDLYQISLLASKNSHNNIFNSFQNQNYLKYVQKKSKIEKQLLNKDDPYNLNLNNFHLATKRKITKTVYKVLDAPTLQDDYYLNLLDWSFKNIMAVALSSNLYLWNASTSTVSKLCQTKDPQIITSLSWSRDGHSLAIGGSDGQVSVWDVELSKKIRTFKGHSGRVATIGWNYNCFSTGSRDKSILHRDLRSSSNYYAKLKTHKQQVCGLKWSEDDQYLCSGGNDNKVFVWSSQSNLPVWKFQDHLAAVKAIAWSPHKHGLLVSGGGTADKTIKFRNILTGQCTKSINTNSQVCNLMFSKTVDELVSTHGYSNNQVKIWNCPSMQNIATLIGHTMRVLYLTMSPDGSTIVTGAGDETLRFWNVFPSIQNSKEYFSDRLELSTLEIR